MRLLAKWCSLCLYQKPEGAGVTGARTPSGSTIIWWRSGVPRNPVEIPSLAHPFGADCWLSGPLSHPLSSPDLSRTLRLLRSTLCILSFAFALPIYKGFARITRIGERKAGPRARRFLPWKFLHPSSGLFGSLIFDGFYFYVVARPRLFTITERA